VVLLRSVQIDQGRRSGIQSRQRRRSGADHSRAPSRNSQEVTRYEARWVRRGRSERRLAGATDIQNRRYLKGEEDKRRISPGKGGGGVDRKMGTGGRKGLRFGWEGDQGTSVLRLGAKQRSRWRGGRK